ncbi:ATP-binding protein [Phytohabitans aurantiacus]|uniref:ATPase n=1 Tax=Phytohabitans aurantiacus TaxID=3016789 RepID=A0ABQ5QTM9_9ACTN|nr:tetratricopeptide repeat protein [Phytohabitans aurantiacus]GLH97607.1 ATPase [Phytohabitans aurantiacus]
MTTADRNLQARSSDRVYQAAGNQYIIDRMPRADAGSAGNTLPRDTAAFTGRERELRGLVESVRQHAECGRTIPVYTIDGMPGVGKTALAVHAGHCLADQFPDGQFFLDLHGYTAGRRDRPPAGALFDLLLATGARPSQIPTDLDARTALWRKRMAGRKALLVLDNAAGRSQVQPLLPGAGSCLVIVTSRRRLLGLGASQSAVPLALETLPPQDAVALFAATAGRDRDLEEAEAVAELVRLAGYLPLAICLLAARIRPEPGWLVGDLVADLARATRRLDHLRAEDVAVGAAFDLSYRRLPPARRRFFRRLGLHPGIDLDQDAAAALGGTAPDDARRHLEALYRDRLVDQPVYGRYRLHDLIGQYAQALSDQAGAEREAALDRLAAHYQRAAQAADQRLARGSDCPPPARQQALQWMRVESANVFACAAALPISAGHRLTALAAAMAGYLRAAGPWDRATALHQAAALAAERVEDRGAQARALLDLGEVYRLTGRYLSAEHALLQALDLFERAGDGLGVAGTLTQLAHVQRRTGDQRGAADRLTEAVAGYEKLGNLRGQADALDELGVVRYQIGDHRAALDAMRQALAIHRDLDDRSGEATALCQFGAFQLLTGEYPPAIDAFERALAVHRELGDRHGQGCALNYLGIAHCHAGGYAAATAVLTEALTLHCELGYRPGQANALNYLGVVACRTGDLPAAERSLTGALALYRDLGSRPGQADALNQLGVVSRLAGDHGAAQRRHEEALALFRGAGDHLGQAEALSNLGDLLLAKDDPEAALDRYRRALPLGRRAGNPRAEANAREGLGRCAAILGDHGKAADQFRRARAIWLRVGAPHAVRALDELSEGLGRMAA